MISTGIWVIKIDRIFFSSDNFLENIRVVGLFLQGINVSYSLKKLKLQAENQYLSWQSNKIGDNYITSLA